MCLVQFYTKMRSLVSPHSVFDRLHIQFDRFHDEFLQGFVGDLKNFSIMDFSFPELNNRSQVQARLIILIILRQIYQAPSIASFTDPAHTQSVDKQ